MGKVEINETMHLFEHMTLGEVTKSRHEGIYNIPSHGAIWLHFAVRPKDNRRKTSFILKI
jgi:hypothetical protein